MKSLIKFFLNTIPRPLLIRMSYLFRLISRFWYKGNNYECNICGSKYRKMLPYGYVHPRENALCPNCLSLERHRLIWMYLQNETDFFTGNYKVLHIAPEQSFLERFKKLSNLDYTTADMESPIADVKCDVQQMPFNNNKFDFVFCNHVLEHVQDETRAMSEILRVLKPGGKAILLVPMDFSLEETFEDPTITDPKERNRLFGQYDHVRQYGRDYPERLKKVGFKIPEINYIEKLDTDTIKRFCLPAEEYMYGYGKSS